MLFSIFTIADRRKLHSRYIARKDGSDRPIDYSERHQYRWTGGSSPHLEGHWSENTSPFIFPSRALSIQSSRMSVAFRVPLTCASGKGECEIVGQTGPPSKPYGYTSANRYPCGYAVVPTAVYLPGTVRAFGMSLNNNHNNLPHTLVYELCSRTSSVAFLADAWPVPPPPLPPASTTRVELGGVCGCTTPNISVPSKFRGTPHNYGIRSSLLC